jgi:hypothetical protein
MDRQKPSLSLARKPLQLPAACAARYRKRFRQRSKATSSKPNGAFFRKEDGRLFVDDEAAIQLLDQRVSWWVRCTPQFGQNFFIPKRSGSLRRLFWVV